MGERHKLVLQYVSASEEDKDEAKRALLGDCGSLARFEKSLKEAAKRGWADSDGITDAGKRRLARYPDAPGPTSPPVIIRG